MLKSYGRVHVHIARSPAGKPEVARGSDLERVVFVALARVDCGIIFSAGRAGTKLPASSRQMSMFRIRKAANSQRSKTRKWPNRTFTACRVNA
jgi:hypothetical protein